ncbi:ABC transporter ATP-binding protein [Microbulbifer sp. GL-2]|uniref:ABC transporter ATP-binding protein n=1 Tax=Microbulbifer sp. GL-2 TaxID=2591606 RepID=UPI0011643CC0|nr:ABC transporter ATP-binding protein [Microbulbifer sp. GL-2]BBM03083.1 lipoprotein ABC transporter ATP-binding protein LolD [Microbulbifer sp. GL-2]
MLVELNSVSKRYAMGDIWVDALKDVTLSLEKGEFLAVKGPSGSGKSTLLNILSALDQCDSGTVQVGGVNVGELSEHKRSKFRNRHIGIVFQSFNLIPVLTALENVMYPLTLRGVKEAKPRALQALKDVDLERQINQRPTQLSGGQMQRVAIARAIVTRPDIVLADEPTANLDSKTSENIMALIQKLNKEQDVTFVISTHDDYVTSQATRVITILDGKLVNDSLVADMQFKKRTKAGIAESGVGA